MKPVCPVRILQLVLCFSAYLLSSCKLKTLLFHTIALLICLSTFSADLTSAYQPTAVIQDQSDTEFWDSVYKNNHVLEIELKLTREGWDEMQPKRQGFWPGQRGGDSAEYTYVKSEIIIDGKPYTGAGLRFKGNSSYRFSARSMKRPLKIDINRFNPDQKLYGRTKINLSNAFLDSAFMKEKLAYEIYRSAGLATPGVGWANVTLSIDNKKTALGVYVLIEQVDNRFLEKNFGKSTKGSLMMKPEGFDDWEYLGDDPSKYERYEIKTGKDNVEQIKQFANLIKLINDSSDETFASEIGEQMDLQQFAGYLAATCILSNVDSYIGMPHNYYLLMDKSDNKLRMLPWDVNEAFGTFTMGSSPEMLADWDIDRPWVANRRLLERLFNTEEFPKLYRAAIAKLMKDEFTEEKLFSRIATYAKAIKPYVGNYKPGPGVEGLEMGINGDENGFNRAVSRSVLAIKPFITRRIMSINAQMTGGEGQKIEGRRRR